MILGIDASNIRSGGGVTHLVELLRAAKPKAHGVEKVLVWGSAETLAQLPDRPWLEKKPIEIKNIFYRLIWQRFILPKLAKQSCQVLFVPGGNFAGNFKPFVSMFQNMLPFQFQEMKRYFPRGQFFRLSALRFLQASTFKRSAGVICLSEHAKNILMGTVPAGDCPPSLPSGRHLVGTTPAGDCPRNKCVIPHGIHDTFYCAPRERKPLTAYDDKHPFRLLYVSIVDTYKHQWQVVEAVVKLRQQNMPVVLELIGAAYAPSLRRLNRTIKKFDPKKEFIRYLNFVPYHELPKYYQRADAFVFASSCENFPNILLEAMASGLPIACSNRSSMPDILQDAGVYFDPESPAAIADALTKILYNADLRRVLADRAYQRARQFSWETCATQTFEFLSTIHDKQSNH